jgi:hypothetical protein
MKPAVWVEFIEIDRVIEKQVSVSVCQVMHRPMYVAQYSFDTFNRLVKQYS